MRSTLAVCFLPLLGVGALHAESVTLGAVEDNTIFSESTNSNGAGAVIFAGQNNNGNLRRGLLQFDVAAAIPFGARIDSVSLALRLDGATQTDTVDRIVGLHALSADWGEGTSNSGSGGMSGMGAAPTPDDATWQHRLYPDELWSTPGGDYRAAPSATTLVGIALDYYTWSSGGLIDDVQAWLDGDVGNFGWEIIGDETALGAARRFCSREFPTAEFQPALTIEFTPRIPGDANGDFHVTGADYTIWADHFGQSGVTVNEGDFNGDTLVTGADYTLWADHFGESAAVAVPEPSSIALSSVALLAMALMLPRGSRAIRRRVAGQA